MLKSIFSKKSHTQIITQALAFVVALITIISFGTTQSLAVCRTDPGCTDCHPPTSLCNSSEFQCTGYDLDDYCCTESTSECRSFTDSSYNTFTCNCQPKTTGGYDCRVIGNSCVAGNIPNSSACNPNSSYDPCAGTAYCQLSCVEGALGNINDPCTGNTDCKTGLACGPDNKCVSTDTTDTSNSAILFGLLHKNCDEDSINTALGCIPVNKDAFTAALLKFLIGIAGAAALILMIVGSIMVMTGGSNPEQVQRGKEIFTGAIIGLLFIIFSVVVLQIIAGDIIGLPGFTG